MAPKKKKGDKNALGAEVERRIREEFHNWLRNPQGKADFWANNIGKKQQKVDAANQLWDELVQEELERENAQAAQATQAPAPQVHQPDTMTPPEKTLQAAETNAPDATTVQTHRAADDVQPSQDVQTNPSKRPAQPAKLEHEKDVVDLRKVPLDTSTAGRARQTTQAQVPLPAQQTDSPVVSGEVASIDGGAIANNASTAQVNPKTGVSNASIRDLPRIDWSGRPPSMATPSDSKYERGEDFGSLDGVISKLKDVEDGQKYLIRTELRSNQDQQQRVLTNHFVLQVNPNTKFYEYQIMGIPASAKRNLGKRLMMNVIEDVPFLQQKKAQFATDYFETIISWVDLHSSAPGLKITTRDDNDPDSFEEWRLLDVEDRDGTIQLNLRLVGEVDFGAFRNFAGSSCTNPAAYNAEPVRRALHIVMAKCIQDSDVVHLNANKFFVKAGYVDLRKDNGSLATLHSLRGYHYKIKAGMGKIFLNVTSVTSAFWNPFYVSKVLATGLETIDSNLSSMKGLTVYIDYERGKKGRDAKNGKQNENKDAGEAGETINDEHSRVKRICGFGKAANEQKFEWTPRDKNGDPMTPEKITVADYLLRTYGRTLERPDLLAVNLGTESEPSWFAPEYLKIVPYQIYARVIPDAVAKTFHEISCKMPKSTRACIEREGIGNFPLIQGTVAGLPNCRLLHCDQITLTPYMLDIPRTQLASVDVKYLDETITCRNDSGQWNLSGRKFLLGSGSRIRWKLLRGPSVTNKACEKFIQYFEDQLVTTGVCDSGKISHLGEATFIPGTDHAPMEDNLKSALANLHKTISGEKLKEAKTTKTAKTAENSKSDESAETAWIVVLLLKKKDQDVYSSFKYLADKIYCLQSICATELNFKPKGGFEPPPPPPKELESQESSRSKKPSRGKAEFQTKGKGIEKVQPWKGDQAMQQYMANIAMKANLKAGGINHTATGVVTWLDKTLVLGADLTHAGSSAIANCPSIAAVVSSVSSDGGWFIGQPFVQWKQRSEIITNLELAVRGALDKWIEVHEKWPENVLYYRDGVGEGQYDEIKTSENAAIASAWDERWQTGASQKSTPTLKLTTIIVSKRHSTRFFPAKKEDAMFKNDNCKPGLLVDSAVTDPYYSDFYLQSHKALKGTARPCHYFVLNNGMGIGMEELQDLTHKLCHTYVRSTTGVSYVPPTYYADRLCERGRCYLRKWLQPNLATRREWDIKRKQILDNVKRERANKKKQASAPQKDWKAKGKAEDKQENRKRKKKSKEEKEQDKREKEELMEVVNKKLELDLSDQIDRRWFAEPVDDEAMERKDWNFDTMYWM